MSEPLSLTGTRHARELGDVLRAVRKRRGWTRKEMQHRLARAAPPVGVSLQTLATYELGTRHVSTERLFAVCAILGVSVQEVVAAVEERLAPHRTLGLITVDLHQVIRHAGPELASFRRWAREYLACANQPSSYRLTLTSEALAPLSAVCRMPVAELITSLGVIPGCDVTELVATIPITRGSAGLEDAS